MMKEKLYWKSFLFAILVFIGILFFPFFEDEKVNVALAILILTAILWITEAIPLAMTALVIPVLFIILKIA